MKKQPAIMVICPKCKRIKKQSQWVRWDELTSQELQDIRFYRLYDMLTIMHWECPKCYSGGE